MGEARAALLDRCLEFLKSGGFSQLSLREIAAGAGTSHRMLIYHFGSREGLLAEVVGRVESEQRAALASLASTTDDPVEIGRQFWRRLADPALAPAERLFFELYAQALYGQQWTEAFRASVIAAWTESTEAMFAALGFDAHESRLRARLALAATRGLLLDLLITGDRELLNAASDLFGSLISAPRPDSGPRPSPKRAKQARSTGP